MLVVKSQSQSANLRDSTENRVACYDQRLTFLTTDNDSVQSKDIKLYFEPIFLTHFISVCLVSVCSERHESLVVHDPQMPSFFSVTIYNIDKF